MTIQIEIPMFWMLFDPEGRAKGSMYGAVKVRPGGKSVYTATEEEAWKKFYPVARAREAAIRKGFVVRPVDNEDDWADYWHDKRRWEEPAVETATER